MGTINYPCIQQQSTCGGLFSSFGVAIKTLLIFMITGLAYASDINIDNIAQEAKKNSKQIMFFQHIPGGPYCKAMLDENFKEKALLEEIEEHFIYVDIYTKTEGEIRYGDFKGSYKDFSAHVGAFAYPATTFMDGDGRVIHRAIGYRNIDEYFAEIKYVSTGSYKEMDLDEYKVKLEFEKE